MTAAKPALRPNVPHFSSGPCAKRPGWNPQNLKDAALGRSHRAKIGKARLKLAIELTREVLEVPAGYRIGIVPASLRFCGVQPGRLAQGPEEKCGTLGREAGFAAVMIYPSR